MTEVYLDSSTVLRVIFGEPRPLEIWGEWTAAYSSELLGLEGRRSIDRARLTARPIGVGVIEVYEANLFAAEADIEFVPLTRSVLRRASLPFPTVVSSLDALHLASAIALRERFAPNLLFATHDRQQALAAQAMGFDVVGV